MASVLIRFCARCGDLWEEPDKSLSWILNERGEHYHFCDIAFGGGVAGALRTGTEEERQSLIEAQAPPSGGARLTGQESWAKLAEEEEFLKVRRYRRRTRRPPVTSLERSVATSDAEPEASSGTFEEKLAQELAKQGVSDESSD